MFRTPMESMASDEDSEGSGKGGVKPGQVRSVTVERGNKGASVRIEKEPKKGKDGKIDYEPSKSDFFSSENEAFKHAQKQFGDMSKSEDDENEDEDKDEESEDEE